MFLIVLWVLTSLFGKDDAGLIVFPDDSVLKK